TPRERTHAPERTTAPASLRISKLLFILLFGQSLSDGFLGQRGHDLVPCVVRQEAVAGQFLLKIAPVHQGPIKIQINRSAFGGVILQPSVHPDILPCGRRAVWFVTQSHTGVRPASTTRMPLNFASSTIDIMC